MNWIIAHWVHIVAACTTLWTASNIAFNKISNSLPAPTAKSTDKYIWWFKFVNNMSGNYTRANGTRIEDSPNFIPAAEKYMADKLAANGKKS